MLCELRFTIKKGDIMAMKSKKGFITHPITWIIIALILGIVATIIIAKGNIMNLGGIVCPIK